MAYLAAVILGVIAVEVLLRLPLVATSRNVLAASRNSMRVMRSKRLPDEKKQQFLLQYSWRSFVNTCLLTVQLFVLGLVVAIVFWIETRVFSLETTLIYETSFLVVTTVASIFYVVVRKRFA
ncbi:MAG: hypothetical protein ACOCVL_00540 [Candidatus Sumerlaeota bacterium]